MPEARFLMNDLSPAEAPPALTDASAKPTMRGVLHQAGALVALGAGTVLVLDAPTRRAALASAIYALSILTLFSVSAVYHRVAWRPQARALMRRLDHASIFLLIAGTYTPICLLALPPEEGNRLLLLIWAEAAAGMLQAVFWVHAPKPLTAVFYLLVGWSVVPYLPAIRLTLHPWQLGLMVAGGLVYSVGALTYAFKRPNPRPGVFGYHEVFHALTLVACALHFFLMLSVVRRA